MEILKLATQEENVLILEEKVFILFHFIFLQVDHGRSLRFGYIVIIFECGQYSKAYYM